MFLHYDTVPSQKQIFNIFWRELNGLFLISVLFKKKQLNIYKDISRKYLLSTRDNWKELERPLEVVGRGGDLGLKYYTCKR